MISLFYPSYYPKNKHTPFLWIPLKVNTLIQYDKRNKNSQIREQQWQAISNKENEKKKTQNKSTRNAWKTSKVQGKMGKLRHNYKINK